MDYTNWIFKDWPTPLSSLSALFAEKATLVSGALEIKFLSTGPAREDHFVLRCAFAVAFRSINESFRNRLLAVMPLGLGNTILIEGSDLANLRFTEPIPDSARHYLILTQDDVFEILSATEPRIRSIQR